MGKMLPVTEIHGKMLNEIHGIDFTKLDDFLTKLSYEFHLTFSHEFQLQVTFSP
jgi:hypothetical protein